MYLNNKYHTMLPIITVNLDNHNLLKYRLIEILTDQKSGTVRPDNRYSDEISNTDWFVNTNNKELYWNYLSPYLYPVMKNTYENYIGYHDWKIGEYWFQQYEYNDKHEWHFHPGCLYNNIYYVELGDDGPKTELMVPVTGEIIVADIREGDILIFPSVFKHRSPPNLGGGRKTVISFNVI